jgi:hypothetical protein
LSADNRRQPRFVVEGLQGKLTFSSEVEIINMSLSGVALKLDRRLNIGSEYTLKLEIEDRDVSVNGVIVWAALDEMRKGRLGEDITVYSAGMKFTNLMTPRLAQLLEFIDLNKLIPDKRLGGVRFSIDAPGKALLDVPQPYHVKVISLRGMLIEADRRIEAESRCPMEMSFDDNEPVRFEGRVAFCSQVANEGRMVWHMGIEFVEMPAADLARLDAFIQALARH